jgi:hypothetical protein
MRRNSPCGSEQGSNSVDKSFAVIRAESAEIVDQRINITVVVGHAFLYKWTIVPKVDDRSKSYRKGPNPV